LGAIALVAALSSTSAAHAAPVAAPDESSPEFPEYVMRKIDDIYRGDHSRGVMKMTIKTRHWKRTLEMGFAALGTEYSLVRIRKPEKERGTATLKAKDDLFTYLSKTDRTIKITAGMMGGSWMGSHFTNDDLIQESRRSEDYTIALTSKGEVRGEYIYRFTLTPKPDAAVVWGKIEVDIRKRDLQPLREAYYDEDGAKVREMVFSDHKIVDCHDKDGDKIPVAERKKHEGHTCRILPAKMVMRPLDGSGEYTEVLWTSIDFDVELDKGYFTLVNLKSM
jgi:hypothetical protein